MVDEFRRVHSSLTVRSLLVAVYWFDRACSNSAGFHTGFIRHGRRLEPAVGAPARPDCNASGKRAFGPAVAETLAATQERFAASMTGPTVLSPVSGRAMRSVTSRRSKSPTFHRVAHHLLGGLGERSFGGDFSENPCARVQK